MARSELTINSEGLDRMFKALEKKTGASYRDVVRGVTGAALENAAKKTKSAKTKNIKQAVDSRLRLPLRLRDGSKIGVTKAGKVWFQGRGWPGRAWALVRQDGKLANPPSGATPLSRTQRSELRKTIAEAKRMQKKELAYRKERIGMGAKTFLVLLKKLRIPFKNSARISQKVQGAKVDPKAKSAVNGKERPGSKTDYNILISSRAQSALNPKAGGIDAFAKALNGQAKAFKTAARKDLETYARKFAARNGFKVR